MRRTRLGIATVAPASVGVVLVILGVIWFFTNPSGVGTDVAVTKLAYFAGTLLLLCAFTGICAMATVEFLIRMLPLRGQFQRSSLESLGSNHAVHAIGGFVAGGDSRRFDLAVGVLMAQLSAAADMEMDRLKRRDGWPNRMSGVAPVPTKLRSASPLLDALGQTRDVVRARKPSPQEPPPGGPSPDEVLQWETLEAQINASIDDIQALLDYTWRRQLRIWAALASTFYGLVCLVVVDVGPEAKASALIATAVIGGYFAWLARDIAALVERKAT